MQYFEITTARKETYLLTNLDNNRTDIKAIRCIKDFAVSSDIVDKKNTSFILKLDKDSITNSSLNEEKLEHSSVTIKDKQMQTTGSGTVSHIQKSNVIITIKVSSITKNLNSKICENYSNECRANLGDENCKYQGEIYQVFNVAKTYYPNTLALRTVNSFVSENIKDMTVINKNTKEIMLKTEIVNQEGSIITTKEILPQNKPEEMEVLINIECGKTFLECRDRFNNEHNFCGEPSIENISKTGQD